MSKKKRSILERTMEILNPKALVRAAYREALTDPDLKEKVEEAKRLRDARRRRLYQSSGNGTVGT